jgi:hypothetical protein
MSLEAVAINVFNQPALCNLSRSKPMQPAYCKAGIGLAELTYQVFARAVLHCSGPVLIYLLQVLAGRKRLPCGKLAFISIGSMLLRTCIKIIHKCLSNFHNLPCT